MSRAFYNYDTRGPSPSTQIINLERMVEERDEQIAKLQDKLENANKEIRRLPEKTTP